MILSARMADDRFDPTERCATMAHLVLASDTFDASAARELGFDGKRAIP